jgi:hypothetical protein
MTGRRYTWANFAEVQTYKKLDRVLVTTDWEQKFLLASIKHLPERSQIIHLFC